MNDKIQVGNTGVTTGYKIIMLLDGMSDKYLKEEIIYSLLKLEELKYIVLSMKVRGFNEHTTIEDVTYLGHKWIECFS